MLYYQNRVLYNFCTNVHALHGQVEVGSTHHNFVWGDSSIVTSVVESIMQAMCPSAVSMVNWNFPEIISAPYLILYSSNARQFNLSMREFILLSNHRHDLHIYQAYQICYA